MKTLRWISVLSLTAFMSFASAKTDAPAFQVLEKGDAAELLKLPADTLKSARNEFGESLLIRAIVMEKYETAQALLKAKAVDPTILDKSQNDALFYAVAQSQAELAQSLIDSGAILDRTYSEDKENLAFEAARLGDEKMLQLLGKARPELLSGVNNKGQGLIEIAVEAAQSETALNLAKLPAAKKAITKKRKAVLQKSLAKEKKNPRAKELLKLL